MGKGVPIICTYCWVSILIVLGINLLSYLNYLDWIKKQKAIARKKCEQYTQMACNMSILQNASTHAPIMGGQFATRGQFPHMVYIEFTTPKGLAACGGTLISEDFVMTAGHCVALSTPADFDLKMGSLYRINDVDDNIDMFFSVQKIYTHPKYTHQEFSFPLNDVALLKLDRKVNFSSTVRPICLNTELDLKRENVTASGWGLLGDNTEEQPNRLKWVDLRTDEQLVKECYDVTGGAGQEQTVCAAQKSEQKSTCQGDSGGPLQVPMKDGCANTYEQIGITSFGNRVCNMSFPPPHFSWFTKVEFYVPWIVSVVWPNE